LKDLIRSFAATAVIQLANIASGVMLARILLPQGRGELATIMLWPPVIATIGLFGLSEAVAFIVARRIRPLGDVFASALVLAFLFSLVLIPVGWVIVSFTSAALSADTREAAFLYLAFIPLNHLGLVVTSMHQGSLSMGRWNLLRVSIHIIFTGLIIAFYQLGWGTVFGFALASLLSNFLAIMLGFVMARGRAWLSGRLHREPIRELMTFGIKIHLVNCVTILNDRTDQLLISLLLSPTNLGIYVVAVTCARSVSAIGDTLSILVFPKIAHRHDRESQAAIASQYSRAAVILSIPVVILAIVLSPWLIVMVFGENFASAVAITQILLLSIIPTNIRLVLTSVLKGVNQGLEAGTAQLAVLIVSAICLGAMLPLLGLMGAAMVVLCAQIGAAVMMIYRVRQALGLTVRQQLWPHMADVMYVFRTLQNRSHESLID
jgi:O-antigen/teichoic acid export membrane protein